MAIFCGAGDVVHFARGHVVQPPMNAVIVTLPQVFMRLARKIAQQHIGIGRNTTVSENLHKDPVGPAAHMNVLPDPLIDPRGRHRIAP